jgi:ribosome-binding protein aMBF1 (putative translation factor)
LSSITGQQIRAARAALGWSATKLAEKVGVAMKTIARLEQTDGTPETRLRTILGVQQTLEAAGIEFIGTPDDRPGIRISSKSSE